MGEFVIGKTDFGIDPDSAIFELAETDEGLFLTLEIDGTQDDFDRIHEKQAKKWGWASYPPSFYLRDFPVPANSTSGTVTIPLDRNAYQEYEVALYMMEHNLVEGTVTITDGKEIVIVGETELIGKPTPFRIKWFRGA